MPRRKGKSMSSPLGDALHTAYEAAAAAMENTNHVVEHEEGRHPHTPGIMTPEPKALPAAPEPAQDLSEWDPKLHNYIKQAPPGDPVTWTEEHWQWVDALVNQCYEEQGDDMGDQFWEYLTSMDTAAVAELPDAECTAEELKAANGEKAPSDPKLFEKPVPVPEDMAAVCIEKKCLGEGVAGMKYNQHLAHCPVSEFSKANPQCSMKCEGPGSGEGQKYSSHEVWCKFVGGSGFEPHKAGVSFTGGSSSWSGYGCTHDNDQFKLDNGLTIGASATRDAKVETRENIDVGVYLDQGWMKYGGAKRFAVTSQPIDLPWLVLPEEDPKAEHVKRILLAWPDMGVPDPAFKDQFIGCVKWMLEQMAAGVKMETGCMGGHGRTGTMLACLLVAQGVFPGQAIKRVRADHCSHAVESEKQVEFVAAFYEAFHGNSEWRKTKYNRRVFNQQKPSKGSSYKSTGTGFQGSGTGHKAPPAPASIWRADLGAWVCSQYKAGFAWNKELSLYVEGPVGMPLPTKHAGKNPPSVVTTLGDI